MKADIYQLYSLIHNYMHLMPSPVSQRMHLWAAPWFSLIGGGDRLVR